MTYERNYYVPTKLTREGKVGSRFNKFGRKSKLPPTIFKIFTENGYVQSNLNMKGENSVSHYNN